MLGLGFGCVLVANGSNKAEFRHASEHLGRNTRTARVIAEIVGEHFFPEVWSLEARFDRYLRNGESPTEYLSDRMWPLGEPSSP